MGQALLEQLVNQEGLLINPNFLEYHLPRFLDVPEEIIAILIERPHPEGPYGAKAVGKTALIPVAPAIANAIEDAVGVRIKELPITPEKVLRALQQKKAEMQPEERLTQAPSLRFPLRLRTSWTGFWTAFFRELRRPKSARRDPSRAAQDVTERYPGWYRPRS